ncbi:MAG: TnpV protein [Clostridia bacterium]|nr:TnpV protein [Clostridia bacterium]
MKEMAYIQNGDYQIPLLMMEEVKGSIGKYGMMRKDYLKEHKKARFQSLILQEELDSHLIQIDQETRMKVDSVMQELLEKNPAPDKEMDSIAWTQHMNHLKFQAEELVLPEIIFN